MEVKMKVKRFIKGLALVSFAILLITGSGYAHTIDNVVITPDEPLPDEAITITVEGTFSDGCERVTDTLTTTLDDKVILQIFTVPPEGPCPEVLTPFVITETIGQE